MTTTVVDITHPLIEAAQRGERKAQKALYTQYVQGMFNVALRMVKSHASAEDVLQEAFIKAFTRLHQFDQQSTFGAWLKRIVVNESLNYLRSKSWTWESIDDQEIAQPVDLTQHTDINKVKAAINQLADGYRVIINLYLFEGYDHQEIASILNISVGTSKSQYSRAKRQLKAALENVEVYE